MKLQPCLCHKPMVMITRALLLMVKHTIQFKELFEQSIVANVEHKTHSKVVSKIGKLVVEQHVNGLPINHMFRANIMATKHIKLVKPIKLARLLRSSYILTVKQVLLPIKQVR